MVVMTVAVLFFVGGLIGNRDRGGDGLQPVCGLPHRDT
jgi:hypothetical protein